MTLCALMEILREFKLSNFELHCGRFNKIREFNFVPVKKKIALKNLNWEIAAIFPSIKIREAR